MEFHSNDGGYHSIPPSAARLFIDLGNPYARIIRRVAWTLYVAVYAASPIYFLFIWDPLK